MVTKLAIQAGAAAVVMICGMVRADGAAAGGKPATRPKLSAGVVRFAVLLSPKWPGRETPAPPPAIVALSEWSER